MKQKNKQTFTLVVSCIMFRIIQSGHYNKQNKILGATIANRVGSLVVRTVYVVKCLLFMPDRKKSCTTSLNRRVAGEEFHTASLLYRTVHHRKAVAFSGIRKHDQDVLLDRTQKKIKIILLRVSTKHTAFFLIKLPCVSMLLVQLRFFRFSSNEKICLDHNPLLHFS